MSETVRYDRFNTVPDDIEALPHVNASEATSSEIHRVHGVWASLYLNLKSGVVTLPNPDLHVDMDEANAVLIAADARPGSDSIKINYYPEQRDPVVHVRLHKHRRSLDSSLVKRNEVVMTTRASGDAIVQGKASIIEFTAQTPVIMHSETKPSRTLSFEDLVSFDETFNNLFKPAPEVISEEEVAQPKRASAAARIARLIFRRPL